MDIEKSMNSLLSTFGKDVFSVMKKLIDSGKVKIVSLESLAELAHRVKNLNGTQREVLVRLVFNPKVGTIGERNLIKLTYEIEKSGDRSLKAEEVCREVFSQPLVGPVDGRDLPGAFRELSKLSEEQRRFLKALLSSGKFTSMSSYCHSSVGGLPAQPEGSMRPREACQRASLNGQGGQD